MAITKAKILKRRNELALSIARHTVELPTAKTNDQVANIQAAIDADAVLFKEFDTILSDEDEGDE